MNLVSVKVSRIYSYVLTLVASPRALKSEVVLSHLGRANLRSGKDKQGQPTALNKWMV